MKHHKANQHMYYESPRKTEREKDVKIIGKNTGQNLPKFDKRYDFTNPRCSTKSK